jgi:hypothetical protein
VLLFSALPAVLLTVTDSGAGAQACNVAGHKANATRIEPLVSSYGVPGAEAGT